MTQPAVGGNLVARLQHDHVADDDFFQRQRVELAAAQHLDLQRVLVGVEDLEFAVALVFADEGDAGGQDDGDHHGQPFDERMTAVPGR